MPSPPGPGGSVLIRSACCCRLPTISLPEHGGLQTRISAARVSLSQGLTYARHGVSWWGPLSSEPLPASLLLLPQFLSGICGCDHLRPHAGKTIQCIPTKKACHDASQACAWCGFPLRPSLLQPSSKAARSSSQTG